MKACPGIIMPCGDKCMAAGYGFVVIQDPIRIYDYASALMCGSVFPDLVIPKGKYGPKETLI